MHHEMRLNIELDLFGLPTAKKEKKSILSNQLKTATATRQYLQQSRMFDNG